MCRYLTEVVENVLLIYDFCAHASYRHHPLTSPVQHQNKSVSAPLLKTSLWDVHSVKHQKQIKNNNKTGRTVSVCGYIEWFGRKANQCNVAQAPVAISINVTQAQASRLSGKHCKPNRSKLFKVKAAELM